MRASNSLVEINAVASKSCLKCKALKPASAFKLHYKPHWLKSGERKIYQHLDNTCRKCRWDAEKDRVNAKRRKGGQAGDRNSQAVLTQDWATFIQSETGRRISNVLLAAWSGVSPSCIHLVKSEKSWNKRNVK